MKRTSDLASALLTLALGVLLIIMKSEVITLGITLIGVALIVIAVLEILTLSIVGAVIKAAAGAVVLIAAGFLQSVAVYVIGAALLLYGFGELVKRVLEKSADKKLWQRILSFIQPIFSIAASVVLITSGSKALAWAVILAGALFVADGVLGIINSILKN